MAVSTAELRRRGHSAEDIALAKATQEAHRRAGAPYRTMAEILAGKQARSRPADVVDLTARQLRRRGTYGQAALLADQAALAETDPEIAEQARKAADTLAALARKPNQLELSLYGGPNVTLSTPYVEQVRTKLMASDATTAERNAAMATVLLITTNLEWGGYTCKLLAADLAEMQGMQKADMARTLALLEQIGAISRVKKGRTKIIAVTPEGAFRGRIDDHAGTVARYKAEVIPLAKKAIETTADALGFQTVDKAARAIGEKLRAVQVGQSDLEDFTGPSPHTA